MPRLASFDGGRRRSPNVKIRRGERRERFPEQEAWRTWHCSTFSNNVCAGGRAATLSSLMRCVRCVAAQENVTALAHMALAQLGEPTVVQDGRGGERDKVRLRAVAGKTAASAEDLTGVLGVGVLVESPQPVL